MSPLSELSENIRYLIILLTRNILAHDISDTTQERKPFRNKFEHEQGSFNAAAVARLKILENVILISNNTFLISYF